MNCQRNINSTLPTQLPHKFSYIVAILSHKLTPKCENQTSVHASSLFTKSHVSIKNGKDTNTKRTIQYGLNQIGIRLNLIGTGTLQHL
jgi:hypothetical protein